MPKKKRRVAARGVVASLVERSLVTVLDELVLSEPKTRAFCSVLEGLGLPERAPSAGFRARVMASIGPRSAFARPWVRWTVAAALAGASASLVFLVPALVALGRAWGLGGGLTALTDSWIFVALRFADAASVWEMFRPVAEAISLAAKTPPMLLFLLAQLGIAALALRGLRRLAIPVRSARHVTPS